VSPVSKPSSSNKFISIRCGSKFVKKKILKVIAIKVRIRKIYLIGRIYRGFWKVFSKKFLKNNIL
jgi:hypothetical protein